MKKAVILFLGLITLLSSASAESEKDIKAIVKQVTVFPDRAQLNSETSFDIPVGQTILRIKNLSPYIDAQSILVKGFGDFTVLSVNHQNNYLQNLEDSPEMQSIKNQIESLQLKTEDETAAISVLKEKEAFLVANRALLIKETAVSAEQIKNIIDIYSNNIEQVTLTILKKNRLIKEYAKQISALEQQISAKRGKAELPSGEIQVTVSSDKLVSGKLNLSYVVMNAGWYPTYDIRVNDITKPVAIYYKANVFQNTGVPWNDVKLSFSNATPWVAGNVPVPYTWYVDFYRPEPVTIRGRLSKSAASAPSAANQPAELAVEDLKMEEVAEASFVTVQKRVGETTVTFDVAIPYTIPSNGEYQTIEIQRTETPAEFKYVTVPKLSTMAYLTANIADWAAQNLQTGEATLYFENSYVGKSTLNVNQLTDTLMLSLGTDNGLLIKREKRKDFTTRKVIGSNKTETYSYLISIRNNKPNAVKIKVTDQIPVSTNSDIIIDPVDVTGGKLSQDTGMVTWDMEVKPKETKELVLTYTVKYPKNQTIILE